MARQLGGTGGPVTPQLAKHHNSGPIISDQPLLEADSRAHCEWAGVWAGRRLDTYQTHEATPSMLFLKPHVAPFPDQSKVPCRLPVPPRARK